MIDEDLEDDEEEKEEEDEAEEEAPALIPAPKGWFCFFALVLFFLNESSFSSRHRQQAKGGGLAGSVSSCQ